MTKTSIRYFIAMLEMFDFNCTKQLRVARNLMSFASMNSSATKRHGRTIIDVKSAWFGQMKDERMVVKFAHSSSLWSLAEHVSWALLIWPNFLLSCTLQAFPCQHAPRHGHRIVRTCSLKYARSSIWMNHCVKRACWKPPRFVYSFEIQTDSKFKLLANDEFAFFAAIS